MKRDNLLEGGGWGQGCSVKLGQDKLENLLSRVVQRNCLKLLAGIGEDVAAVSVGREHALLLTVDFFTPVSEDPYTQGWIAANNAVNDVYAKGSKDVLGFMMLLGVPRESDKKTTAEIVRGFSDFVRKEKSQVVGGHTIYNPTYLTGASVAALVRKRDFVKNSTARVGDVLVLTKPLGTDVAVKAFREVCDKPSVKRTYVKAIKLMKESSRPVVDVMKTVGVSAATDVTGFGIAGHAKEMAERSRVDVRITKLPVISGTKELSELLDIPLALGRSPETAGGILMSLPKRRKERLASLLRRSGVRCFEVGEVVYGRGKVFIDDNVELVSV
jgi:selenide,water dikinase